MTNPRSALRLALLVAAPLLLLSLLLLVSRHAARWLVRATRVPRCDLMVVLGGGAKERVASGLELMEAGACDRVMFTGDGTAGADNLSGASVPAMVASQVVASPGPSHSTLDDALITLLVARRGGYGSVLVVTSPYHTRRAAWIFESVLSRSGVEVGVWPSDSFYVDYERWWLSDDGREAVVSEYSRLWVMGLLSSGALAFASASLP